MADIFDFYVRDNRKINFEIAEPIMREDSGVTDFRFHIPKTLNGLEVSDWSWWFVFVNAKKEKYSIALTLSDDPERPLEFNIATYTVDYAMSIKAGTVQFALEAINAGTGGTIDNEWHTLTYETKVRETLQGNQAEYAETESDIISELLIEVRNKVNQLVGGATPTPVNLKSLMTDPQKVYLYTGTEQGEYTGNWYYHNSTQFVSGGVYGAGVVDAVPTLGSSNAVGSNGTYMALENKADKSSLISGYFTAPIAGTGYISRDDGSVGSDTTYSHSDYIDISGYSQLTTRASYDSAFNAFYDASKNFVSAFVIRTGTDLTVAIPTNAVYMRVSTLTARYDASFVFRYLARDNADKISALQDEVSALANQSSDYFTPPIISTGYISNNDGTEQASADYSRSDYVDISTFSKLITVALADGAFNAFYDSNKTFISSFVIRAGTNQIIALPANAAYMRVSAVTASYTNIFRFRLIGYVNAVRIADLEDTVDSLANQSADYFTPPIEGTGNISRDNGSVVTNADYSHSGYVNISDFKTLTTYATVTGNFNAFYDANKAFISAFTVRAGEGLTLEIPEGAVYMRVSTGTSAYNSTYIFGTVSHSNAVRIGDLEDTVDGLVNGGNEEFFSPPSVGSGNVSRNDGSIQTSNYLHSDYIDISQYSRLITNAEVGSSFNAFYKADKTFIAPFSITAGADKNIEVPFGAMYMRVSAGNDVYESMMKFRTLESITSDALPDYWYGHITDKVDILRSRMGTIGRNGETFVFATDIHWYQNQQKSPKLIKYLLNNLNINMVFLGGDLITEGTKADEVVESLRCIKAFQYPDVFTPMAFGNHDNNSNQSDATQRFDANTVYSLFFKGFEDKVIWMTDTEFSFYFDKAVNKTRYIFLDMGDDGVSKAFTAFAPFRDALLSTPSGYKIVIVAHIIDYGTFTTSLTQMIDAYNARTTVTVNSVVCDFTSASGSVVICLGGHRHYDDEITTAGGVPITVTDCDAMLSVSDITETAGTITEQAFDVVSLDYANMIAYYERIGRNKSRIIHLTPVSASTTLATSLSGTVTWSSRDDSIATVSNGTITRVAAGTVIIRADNGTETEIWVCNS